MDNKKYSKVASYERNPFKESLRQWIKFYPVKGGDDEKIDVVNADTAERMLLIKPGNERWNQQDTGTFVKVYKTMPETLITLNSCGFKILCYIWIELPKDTGTIYLNFRKCMEYCNYKNRGSMYNGLMELIEKHIIAKKADTDNGFYINVSMFFNGDRRKLDVSLGMKRHAENKK